MAGVDAIHSKLLPDLPLVAISLMPDPIVQRMTFGGTLPAIVPRMDFEDPSFQFDSTCSTNIRFKHKLTLQQIPNPMRIRIRCSIHASQRGVRQTIA